MSALHDALVAVSNAAVVVALDMAQQRDRAVSDDDEREDED